MRKCRLQLERDFVKERIPMNRIGDEHYAANHIVLQSVQKIASFLELPLAQYCANRPRIVAVLSTEGRGVHETLGLF